jgi:putative salt-induced outer membrane protein
MELIFHAIRSSHVSKYTIAAATLLALAGSAAAQDGGEEDPLAGKASLGYLATSGNTDSTNTNAAFNLVWMREFWQHEFDLSAVKASSADVKTAEAYTAAYEARRDLGEKGYLFAALGWQSDEFSTYESSLSESVGYGRRLVATDRHTLNTEIGAGARRLERIDGTEENEAILRAALDYLWTIGETTSFDQDLLIESGSSNTSLISVSELRARIVGNLALVLSYRIKSNSDVLPGTEKTDRFTAISLEYAF